MKINVEALIWTVINNFESTTEYYNKEWEKPNRAKWWLFERAVYHGDNAIHNICEICNFDRQKLELMAKAIRKWESKRNYEKCFTFEKHYDMILSYISK